MASMTPESQGLEEQTGDERWRSPVRARCGVAWVSVGADRFEEVRKNVSGTTTSMDSSS